MRRIERTTDAVEVTTLLGTDPLSTPRPGRAERPEAAPARPPVAVTNSAPVLTRRPPPITVRLSQFVWILALFVGGFTVVYYFAIREDQLPLITEAIRAVDGDRPDATYDSAADIVFWTVFWIAAGALLVQIALLVSFMNRKPHIRLMQLGTLAVLALTYALASNVVAVGPRGGLLDQMFLGQVGLGALALLLSSLTGGLAWTARRHDVRTAAGDGAEV